MWTLMNVTWKHLSSNKTYFTSKNSYCMVKTGVGIGTSEVLVFNKHLELFLLYFKFKLAK